jgi:hypothetical protein
MAWTATVTSVEKLADVITVTIYYQDGANNYTGVYKLYGAPGTSWLEKTAQTEIDRLIGINNTNIPTGAVSPYTWPASIPGDAAYIVQSGFQALAQNKVFISLFNASGSGRKVKVWAVKMQKNFAAVTGVAFQMNLSFTSTLGSGGTTLSPRKTHSGLPELPAQISALHAPTTAPTETVLLFSKFLHSEETNAAGAVDEMIGAIWPIVIQGQRGNAPITLNEGEGINLKQITATTAGVYNCAMIFTIE